MGSGKEWPAWQLVIARYAQRIIARPAPCGAGSRRRIAPGAVVLLHQHREKGITGMNQQALSSFIWSVADLLRGDYKQSEYGRVILPFTVLRRLDCVLEPTKDSVLKEYAVKQKTSRWKA